MLQPRVDATNKQCATCGRSIATDHLICPDCGCSSFSPILTDPPWSELPLRRRLWLAFVYTWASILGLALLGYFAWVLTRLIAKFNHWLSQ